MTFCVKCYCCVLHVFNRSTRMGRAAEVPARAPDSTHTLLTLFQAQSSLPPEDGSQKPSESSSRYVVNSQGHAGKDAGVIETEVPASGERPGSAGQAAGEQLMTSARRGARGS